MKPVDSYRFFLITAFVYRLCWMVMITVSMVYMVEVAKLDPLQMVLVGTVLEASVFFLEVPTGIVADTYSRKLSMVIGYILMGGGYMIIGFFPTFGVILVSQVIWGAGATFLSGASQAWITEEIGETRANKAFLLASQFGRAGALVGIALAVALAMVDLALPIILGSFGLVLFGVLAYFLMEEKNFHPTRDEDKETWHHMAETARSGIRTIRGRPLLILILLIAAIHGLYSEGFDRLYTPFLLEKFSLPPFFGLDSVAWWGALSAGATIFGFIGVETVRRRLNTSSFKGLVTVLTWTNALLIAAMILFVASGNFYLAIVAWLLVTTMRAIEGPVMSAWLNRGLDKSSRATIFSLHAQSDAFGQVVGGPFIGALGKYASLATALLVSTLLLAPNLALFRLAFRRHGHEEEAGERGAD